MLVTGGAGFIGSALVRFLLTDTHARVVNLDALTYAGNLRSLEPVSGHANYRFERADIGDPRAVSEILRQYQPDAIVHLAAESHVDRSIDGPAAFIQTNILGTYTLLEAALAYWRSLEAVKRGGFIFHHVSTDEVFGSLPETGMFTESSAYQPNSPYAASKAAADHLVRAWFRTYGLPVIVTNCSNNYGPYQFPEKLVPLTIINALNGKSLPVYGTGANVRDWLHVEDHVRALWVVATNGEVGATYNIGANNERTNLEVVKAICSTLDRLLPQSSCRPHASLIEFVADRPGHDRRYAIDAEKIGRDLGWRPIETFESGLAKTVRWYLDNRAWWQDILTRRYAGERLGLAKFENTTVEREGKKEA